jgi:uncharacterized protein YbcC (UPF0753/DUF2309 family)
VTQSANAKPMASEANADCFPGLSSEARAQVRDEAVEACNIIAQSWPMKIFAYRNPLRGLEHLSFDEAICEGKRVLGGKGYLPNDDYRHLYRDGIITEDAVDGAIRRSKAYDDSQEITVGTRRISSFDVLRLHLLFGFDEMDPALLSWQLSGGGLTREFRHDLPKESRNPGEGVESYLTQLWESTLSVLDLADASDEPQQEDEQEEDEQTAVELPAGQTISDWLGLLAGASMVDRINDQMIKWVSAFLDEGLAGWEMPERHAGFYLAWRDLAARDFSGRFLGIKRFARKIRNLPDSPEDAIAEFLSRLGIPEERRSDYQARQFAQLPGWVGFIRWRGERPHYPEQKKHPIDPVQYLAVRLFYEVELVEAFCRRKWKIDGTLSALTSHWEANRDEYDKRAGRNGHAVDRRTQAICSDAWRLFHLAQFLKLAPSDVEALSSSDIQSLLGWLNDFPGDDHGPVWLDALESKYRNQLIGQLSTQVDKKPTEKERPRAQLAFCIDARSEPFRRHIEAQGPYETHGYAGFFGIPIRHQAFDDDTRQPLCPVPIFPGFAVGEVPRGTEDGPLQTYATGSRWNKLGQHLFHDLKKNPVGSLMLIDALGLFYSFRLAGKTFFTKTYEGIKSWTRKWFAPKPATEIPIDVDEDHHDEATPPLPHGFTLEEQAFFVEKGLRAMGLTENFAPLMVLCGHGSTADNNPYAAAYNCGACGGGHGDPNARIFAAMGNRPGVRRILGEHGISVPDDTLFVAAKHDMVTDRVTLYDQEDTPDSFTEDIRLLAKDLERAGAPQALERCRRIPQAPKNVSPEQAYQHVRSRSMDWANVRPEWGLSSNFAFVVGKRWLTRDLNLNGRCFLHCYDSDADSEGAVLEGIMTAPLVVTQWISMEYYFSAVDPWFYGAGSKVTHNVVSGVGVMHGAHSDLESGLPLQGVNDGSRHYHEPVRLVAVLQAPISRISAIIQKHELLQHIFHNQWIHLMAVDPATGEFHRYNPDSTWVRYS